MTVRMNGLVFCTRVAANEEDFIEECVQLFRWISLKIIPLSRE